MSAQAPRIAVLGCGAWGTAFGKVLADVGADVMLWARRPELAHALNTTRQNPDYLPGIVLPLQLQATSDAKQALEGAEVVVLAIPSQTLRDNLVAVAGSIPPESLLVSLMKGIELGSTKRMSEVVREVADVVEDRVVVVTGPNLAKEIAAEQPTASVVACTDPEAAARVQRLTHTSYFRPYTNTDVVGCELGGAVKNVIALAVGMAEGMGFGDNTKASLITRGLKEITNLGVALGADPATFAGLAGLGDLVATCSSPLSRNHRFGSRLGRGESVQTILQEPHLTAEGYKSCQSILALGIKHDVEMPITEMVTKVCHEGLAPVEMVRALMSREAGSE
jgi:glycerol-3-phosphate dehydrogenase (NAD(P)+)